MFLNRKKYDVYYNVVNNDFSFDGSWDAEKICSCTTKSEAQAIINRLNSVKLNHITPKLTIPLFEKIEKLMNKQNNEQAVYVVVGEYPNIFIDKRYFIAQDNYNVCLKDSEADCIAIYKKDRVFTSYEEANNKVISLLQGNSLTAGNNLTINNDCVTVEKSNKKRK